MNTGGFKNDFIRMDSSDFKNIFDAQLNQMKTAMEENVPSKDDKITLGPEYRMILLMQHEHTLQISRNDIADTPFLSLQTNSDPISCNHLCLKHEDKLKNAFISDLRINQINYGTKTSVKVISGVSQQVCIDMVVDDMEGNALLLAMYNFAPLRSSEQELSSLLPIGTELIIKEPYVKKSTFGAVTMRIDNVHTNVIVNHPNDPTFIQIKEKDAGKLKEIGNRYFKKKDYKFAIRYYSEALKTANADCDLMGKLLGNRSLCHLKIEKYLEAVHDAQKAVDLGAKSDKMRYRLASALTGIRKHAQALKVLDDVDLTKMKSDSMRNDFKRLTTRIWRRSMEAKQFHQAFSTQEIDSMTWDELRDIDDYFSRSIKIKFIDNRKGRGVFATKNIKKGEVILSEKCMAFGDIDKNKMASVVDVRRKMAFYPSKINLIQKMIDIYQNGSDIQKYKLSLLYKGEKYDKKNDQTPKMDVFRVDELPKGASIDEIPVLNVEQISWIAEKNSFTMACNKKQQREVNDAWKKPRKEQETLLQWETGSGLFIAASFFNHDDRPNVNWVVNYKRIHMTAKRNIKKGQELCIKYHLDGIGHWLNSK